MSLGVKKARNGGSSTNEASGNWGIIKRDKLYVYKTYLVEEDDFEDDTGGHAIREYLVSRMGILGCTPAEVSWRLEGGDLHITFKMPRRICTLRDILQGKFTYGGTLWAQMGEEQRLEFAIKVASDLLIPLAGLHSANLTHQDLHDNNIVFNEQVGRFELIDFGFTCLFSPTQKRRADLMAWCPPPERLGGPSPVLLSADTWSLGNIFVMALWGHMPGYHEGGLAPSLVNGRQMHPNWADLEDLRRRFPKRGWPPWSCAFFAASETRLAACDMMERWFPRVAFSSRASLRRRAWPPKLLRVLLLANSPLNPGLTLARLDQISRMRSLCPVPVQPPLESRARLGCCGPRGRTRSAPQKQKCRSDKRRRRSSEPPEGVPPNSCPRTNS